MMATVPEDDTFPEGVYRIETTDPVLGGPPNEGTGAGLVNIPTMHLAKRTRWLKNRIDVLLGSVVAASTVVSGIVRLSTSTASASTTEAATPSAVKAAMDNANTRAPATRSISAGGLATGGGTLAADRTIDVPKATQAEAEAGVIDTKAMTPLSVKQAISKAVADLTALEALATTIADWNVAITNGVYKAVGAANAPINAYLLGTVEAFSATSVTQTVHVTTSDADIDTKTYRRSMDGGVWGAWYQLRISQSEQALLWVPLSRSVSASGLATGGGTLGADRTITVAEATQAEAEAGTIQTKAMTPLRVAQVFAARLSSGALQAGSAILTAISVLAANGFVVRTANGVVAARSISAGTAMNVINGDGVAGNPAIGMIVPTQAEAEAGVINTKGMTPLRTMQAINNCSIGRNQTWQNMSASRAMNTAYQNTTVSPIMVSVDVSGNNGTGALEVSADGTTWMTVANRDGDGNAEWFSTIVPSGTYYRLSGNVWFANWTELR